MLKNPYHHVKSCGFLLFLIFPPHISDPKYKDHKVNTKCGFQMMISLNMVKNKKRPKLIWRCMKE